MVARIVAGPRPLELAVLGTCSMMVTDPEAGQPTPSTLAPRIQTAGHSPAPTVDLSRTSRRPYWNSLMACVFMRADVQAPLGVLAAWITRFPSPSCEAYRWRRSQGNGAPGAQYTSSSRFPQPPLLPVSKAHLSGSGSAPLGPANSSLQAGRFHSAMEGGLASSSVRLRRPSQKLTAQAATTPATSTARGQ